LFINIKRDLSSVINVIKFFSGDVIGSLLDLDAKEIVFSVNGKALKPFDQVSIACVSKGRVAIRLTWLYGTIQPGVNFMSRSLE